MGHFSWNIRPVIIVYSHREKYQGEEETIQRQQTVEENSKGGSLYTLSCPLVLLELGGCSAQLELSQSRGEL